MNARFSTQNQALSEMAGACVVDPSLELLLSCQQRNNSMLGPNVLSLHLLVRAAHRHKFRPPPSFHGEAAKTHDELFDNGPWPVRDM